MKALTFQELDRLVDAALAGNDECPGRPLDQLSEMNAKALALASVERRESTWRSWSRPGRSRNHGTRSSRSCFSLDGMTELQAVRDRLITAGLYEQLFADLGSDLWDLLMEVGKKFGDHKELTVREFIGLVAEALNLTMQHDVGLSRNVEQEQTAVVDLKKMIEIEEAVRAAMGFVLGTLEAIKIMLTQPEKILSALWELDKLTYTCYLAWYGHEASTKQLKELVQKVGSAVGGALVNGLRGAALLGVGPRASHEDQVGGDHRGTHLDDRDQGRRRGSGQAREGRRHPALPENAQGVRGRADRRTVHPAGRGPARRQRRT
ncbi:hypothetical protein LV779_25630 [Streptomyces thinghirensis]|nr:hypothetical protein [Streptomyces thinghirensis]